MLSAMLSVGVVFELVSLRLHLRAYDRKQVRPPLGLVKRHLSEANDEAIVTLGRTGIDLVSSQEWEDALRIALVLADESFAFNGRERKSHTEDVCANETTIHIRTQRHGIKTLGRRFQLRVDRPHRLAI
jgi:hypothetical protein